MEPGFTSKETYLSHFNPRDYLEKYYSFGPSHSAENKILRLLLKSLFKIFCLGKFVWVSCRCPNSNVRRTDGVSGHGWVFRPVIMLGQPWVFIGYKLMLLWILYSLRSAFLCIISFAHAKGKPEGRSTVLDSTWIC